MKYSTSLEMNISLSVTIFTPSHRKESLCTYRLLQNILNKHTYTWGFEDLGLGRQIRRLKLLLNNCVEAGHKLFPSLYGTITKGMCSNGMFDEAFSFFSDMKVKDSSA
ncbi:hypothetical protein YC2023_119456 [Brassica napus]